MRSICNFFLELDAQLPNGEVIPLKVLVDTGAQVNLVRRELIPQEFWREAKNPIQLITANGSILPGGNEVVTLGLNFRVVEDGFVQPHPMHIETPFICADFDIDAILSYPWLREHRVGCSLTMMP